MISPILQVWKQRIRALDSLPIQRGSSLHSGCLPVLLSLLKAFWHFFEFPSDYFMNYIRKLTLFWSLSGKIISGMIIVFHCVCLQVNFDHSRNPSHFKRTEIGTCQECLNGLKTVAYSQEAWQQPHQWAEHCRYFCVLCFGVV